jgi:hypothetical protein
MPPPSRARPVGRNAAGAPQLIRVAPGAVRLKQGERRRTLANVCTLQRCRSAVDARGVADREGGSSCRSRTPRPAILTGSIERVELCRLRAFSAIAVHASARTADRTNGLCHILQFQFCGYGSVVVFPESGFDRNVSRTIPMRIESPSLSSTAVAIRSSLRHVPFLLPRSSRSAPPSQISILA